jgi:hypothetical protein
MLNTTLLNNFALVVLCMLYIEFCVIAAFLFKGLTVYCVYLYTDLLHILINQDPWKHKVNHQSVYEGISLRSVILHEAALV